MKVAVMGGGPVGLVSGTVLASVGHDVTVVDIDTARIEKIAAGLPPFHEPGLPELLSAAVRAKRLTAVTDGSAAIRAADVVLICVGTPSNEHGADLSALRAVSQTVGEALRGVDRYALVLVKSTVPPGTTRDVVTPLVRGASGRAADTLGIGMNPEFLREGVAVDDMRTPDRVVVGLDSVAGEPVARALYAPFNVPVVITTPSGAEMAKYASNALLATLISYSNEIAQLCEGESDVDAFEVMSAVHLDRRFRPHPNQPQRPSTITSYLIPGLGYGGSCFPKDTAALAAWAKMRALPTPILDAVRAVNASRPERVLALLQKRMQLKGARIAILGLAFKPETDDLRESRSLDFARLLALSGADVVACDPVAGEQAALLLEGVARVVGSAQEALQGADAAILATAWDEYTRLDPKVVRAWMRRPLVLDARRALNRASWSAECEYVPIGATA